ncbi:nucleotidyltransferase domain-containing protein [Candidatus Dojkabacteria bacterium]|nr:nucleotidyltransferase domain-containing protein [Candidatus Dojkabacteria bacterium]
MITDIKKQKEEILEKIEAAGIPKSNLYSVLLFGSHYWGYDSENSDIDLYIILKNKQEKVSDTGNLSLHYQTTLKELNERINSGSWASYYVIKYASYLLFGMRPVLPEFPKKKILKYLDKKKEEIQLIENKNRKWAFLTLIKRVFFLNYFYNGVKSFKLEDFTKCKQLEKKDILFLSKQYDKIFKHTKEKKGDNRNLKVIIIKIEKVIKALIKKKERFF